MAYIWDKPNLPFSNSESAKDFALGVLNDFKSMKDPNEDRYDAFLNNYLQLLMRDEDFARSTPQQQVERLMAAGMSRAAALQAIGEQQYGSAQTGIAGNAEQSKIAQTQNVMDIVQASVQMLNQGVQFGFAVPSLITQIQGLRYSQQLQHNALLRDNIQTQIAQHQYEALTDTAEFQQMFYNYSKQTGDPLPANLSDMVQCLSEIDKDANPQYYGFDEKWKTAISKPFFFATMSKAYADMVRADYSEEVAKRHAIAGTILAELDGEQAALDLSREMAVYREWLSQSNNRERSANANAEYDEYRANLEKELVRGKRTENASQEAMYNYEFTQGNYEKRSNLNMKLLDYEERLKHIEVDMDEKYSSKIAMMTLRDNLASLQEEQRLNPNKASQMAQDMINDDFLRHTMLQVTKRYFEQKDYVAYGRGKPLMTTSEDAVSTGWNFANHQRSDQLFDAMDALGLVSLLLKK